MVTNITTSPTSLSPLINSENNLGVKTFRKSNQPFLRIEISDEDSVNHEILKPYNQPIPAKIVIYQDGNKRLKNITVQTKVGFQQAFEF